ncbi:MAG TPA: DUF5597 domain-containing protein [Cyclobacteriaceae bacterium]
MKKRITIALFSILTLFSFAQNTTIPHLQANGSTTQLIVKGKPFLILGGEFHNSSTSSNTYMQPLWEQMKKKNLNTLFAPVYWELIEPQENKFDFTLVDQMIEGARKQDLHLVILWFASWKNGYSMYVPAWVKTNTDRFHRVKNKSGESFVVLSAQSDNAMKADAKAFKALMQHIRQVDEKEQTVIMVQIENEAGLFYEPRDYNEEANKAWQQGVPADLIKYLTTNKDKLQPELDSAWKANGRKTSGSWENVFGKSVFSKDWRQLSYLPEELFSVYHYSKYIGHVAAAGKEAYPIPMFVNAWIKQQGFHWPGKYPSGGPIPHTLDLWRMNAPSVDFIAPDIYVDIPEAQYTISHYHRAGNPVFIPEFKPGALAASLAFWAYGQHDVKAFSPFGIEDTTPENDPITKSYAALAQVQELILQHQGKGTMAGIYLDTTSTTQTFKLNGFDIKATLSLPTTLPEGGAVAGLTSSNAKVISAGGILFATAPDEFILLGKDFTLALNPLTVDSKKPKIDIEYLDEVSLINGKWETGRRLNGDESTGGGDYGFGYHNGRFGAVKFQLARDGRYSILKIKFYRY